MSGVLDTIGDLAHHAYDTVTGAIAAPSAPNKPAYSHQDASVVLGGLSSKAADDLRNRKSATDKAIDDAS